MFYNKNIRFLKGAVIMERTVLHIDCNNFFASVECIYNPKLKNVPMAVAGSTEARHGIILAKNELAKKFSVSTGEAIWEAKRKCPSLITVTPDFARYYKYSRLFKSICFEYSDRLESFGIDECWLDVTFNRKSPIEIAEAIRQRVKSELGLTVSIGISFNKIFAKLASDMKKPDAITVIPKDNFKEKIFPLPISDMIGAGKSTVKKLSDHYILTIGDIATANPEKLKRWLGKSGEYLWLYANGLDKSPVRRYDEISVVKSVSNGVTPYRDLVNDDDVKTLIYSLSEGVAMRLRIKDLICRTVSLHIRTSALEHFSFQCKFSGIVADGGEIAETAFRLYKENCKTDITLRSLSVCAADIVPYSECVQLDFCGAAEKSLRRESINRAVDNVRKKFGYGIVKRGILMQDVQLSDFNPKLTASTLPGSFR